MDWAAAVGLAERTGGAIAFRFERDEPTPVVVVAERLGEDGVSLTFSDRSQYVFRDDQLARLLGSQSLQT